MKKQIALLGSYFLAFIVLFSACEFETTESGGSTTLDSPTVDTTVTPDEFTNDSETIKTTGRIVKECPLEGTALEGNTFKTSNGKRLVAITATDDTKDEELGESHRTLEVYNMEDCSRIRRGKLPVNESPDYPYYLAQIQYNNESELVGIRGLNDLYVYDISVDKLTKLKPQFSSKRVEDEPSSGRILRIEVWEDYLIGYAEGSGAFVFDLSDSQAPKPVLPLVDYAKSDDTYSCLFLLPSQTKIETYQVLVPQFNYDDNALVINALMAEPAQVNTNIKDSFRDNRYVVLKVKNEAGNEFPCGIDMEKQVRIDLPEDVQKMKNTAIIAWMKKQQ